MRTLVCVACLSLPLMGSVAAAPVEIMSWNVENLFHTQDDANNPHDSTYLPLEGFRSWMRRSVHEA